VQIWLQGSSTRFPSLLNPIFTYFSSTIFPQTLLVQACIINTLTPKNHTPNHPSFTPKSKLKTKGLNLTFWVKILWDFLVEFQVLNKILMNKTLHLLPLSITLSLLSKISGFSSRNDLNPLSTRPWSYLMGSYVHGRAPRKVAAHLAAHTRQKLPNMCSRAFERAYDKSPVKWPYLSVEISKWQTFWWVGN